MPLIHRNFTKRAPGEIELSPDHTYVECNFARKQPVDTAGVKTGVVIFPGYDGPPMTFTRCNLANCQPPANSVIEACNTTLLETDVLFSTDHVVIDSASMDVEHYGCRRHGRLLPDGTYSYLPDAENTELGIR